MPFPIVESIEKIIIEAPGGFVRQIKNPTKRSPRTRFKKQGQIKMAKEAALKDVSKQELAEAYSKLKARTRNAQVVAKKEGEALISDALTVGTGWGVGYVMGQRVADVDPTDEDAMAEAQQMAGIDIDLLIGGSAAVIGLMKLGGKQSDAVRAIGIGALAEWAGRLGYEQGVESKEEEGA